MDFEVKGLKELNARLQQLPVKMEKKIIRNALRAGAVKIRDEAKVRVRRKTGILARSVRVSTESRFGRAEANIKAGGRASFGSNVEKAYYAHIVEFGAGSRYTGSGGKSKRRKYVIQPRTGVRPTLTNVYGKKGKFLKRERGTALPVRMLRIPMVGPTKSGKGLFAFRRRVLHPGASANPFMRPALQAKATEAIDAFADNVRRNLDQAIR